MNNCIVLLYYWLFVQRVVFLKQLETGLLLVTGPYQINGVPLRRVSQTYVIATRTKVDLSGFEVPDKFNDDYFRRSENKKAVGESVFKESQDVSWQVPMLKHCHGINTIGLQH